MFFPAFAGAMTANSIFSGTALPMLHSAQGCQGTQEIRGAGADTMDIWGDRLREGGKFYTITWFWGRETYVDLILHL